MGIVKINLRGYERDYDNFSIGRNVNHNTGPGIGTIAIHFPNEINIAPSECRHFFVHAPRRSILLPIQVPAGKDI